MAKKKNPYSSKSPRKEDKKKTSKRGDSKKNKKPLKNNNTTQPKPKSTLQRDGAGFSSNKFNYIRSLLWKTFRADFKGYSDPEFIRRVNSVFYDCKSSGGECTDEIIFQHYNIIRENDRRPYPEISRDLFEQEHIYYEIKDIDFREMSSYLWILSPMIIPDPSEFIVPNYYYNYVKLINDVESDPKKFIDEVKNKIGGFIHLTEKDRENFISIANKEKWTNIDLQKFSGLYAKWKGETDKGYRKYFSEWVDWCNSATRNSYGNSFDSDDVEIYFKFTKPEYNEDKKRWETTIFICTPSGQVDSFGYIPQGRSFDHDIKTEYVEPTEEKLTQSPTDKQEIEQKKELERQNKLVEFRVAFKDFRIKLRELKIKKQEADLQKKIENQEKRLKRQREKNRKQKAELKKQLLLDQEKEKQRIARKRKRLAKLKKEKNLKDKKYRDRIEQQKNDRIKLKKQLLKKELQAKDLKRLKSIKKELEKSIVLYKQIRDKKRMKTALADLDAVLKKIKKIS